MIAPHGQAGDLRNSVLQALGRAPTARTGNAVSGTATPVARVGGAAPAPVVPMPSVDLGEAGRFLTLLDEAAEGFTFQTFGDDKTRKAGNLAGILHGSLEDHGPALARLNDAGAGVFVTVNETDGTGRKAANITRARAVFADFDGAPLPDAWPLEPHAIIESSPGRWHAYWITDGLPLADFVPTMHAIAERFGSDRSVCDVARVMRLPGFLHRKGAPFRSRIIHESGAQPYSADTIRATFPVAAPAMPVARATRPVEAVEYVPDATLTELRDALLAIPSDDRDVWQCTGHRLKTLGDRGRVLWLEWSQRSAKWQAGDERQWDTFKPDHTGYRAVFAEAQRCGWHNPMSGAATPAADVVASGPALIAVEVGDLAGAELLPPRFVVDRLIPRRQVTLLGGHGGAGKSTLALVLAAHVAAGKPWAGLAVEAGQVVFVSLEDEPRIVRWRLRNVLDAYALDAGAVAQNLRLLDGTATDASLAAEQADRRATATLAPMPALGELCEAAAGCALIVVDNASDGYEANANDPRMVRVFMRRMLGRIARDADAGVLLLAHIDKDAARHGSRGNAYIGTTAWHNSARSRLALLDTEGRGLELVQEKTNFGAVADSIALQRGEHGVLLLRDGHAANPGAALVAQADAAAVMFAMQAADKARVTVPAARQGPCTAQRALETFPELPAYLHGRAGRARFWRAVGALQADGKVCANSYRTADRKERQRLEICAGSFQ